MTGEARRPASAVRAEYEDLAEAYDRRWAAYSRKSLELLRPYLEGEELGALLDLGCGTGNLRGALRRWRCGIRSYVGVDLSPAMLRMAQAKEPDAGLVAADAGTLPFRPATFDMAVSASSLHDWTDPEAALAGIRFALQPGARLLLLDWCADYRSIRLVSAWLRLTGRAPARVYTRAGLRELLTGAGFRVPRMEARKVSPLWGLVVAEARATGARSDS